VGSIGIGIGKNDKGILARINESLARLTANETTDKILADWMM